MNSSLRRFAALAVVLAFPAFAFGLAADDLLKAEKILRIIVELSAKYPGSSANVKAPQPLTDHSGAFHLPYNSNGTLTEWANKAINAQVGAAVGAKAGEEVGKGVASHVPGGFLVSGLAKKKGKQLGAVAAVGGAEFIKSSSDQSFNTLDEYAVYLHVKHAGQGDFTSALATAIAVYPDLEKIYPVAVRTAVKNADAAAKAEAAAKAAAEKAAADKAAAEKAAADKAPAAAAAH